MVYKIYLKFQSSATFPLTVSIPVMYGQQVTQKCSHSYEFSCNRSHLNLSTNTLDGCAVIFIWLRIHPIPLSSPATEWSLANGVALLAIHCLHSLPNSKQKKTIIKLRKVREQKMPRPFGQWSPWTSACNSNALVLRSIS